jgi:UDP-sugar transporter A1/2/3
MLDFGCWPQKKDEPWGGYKYLACVILCLQNATLVLAMRHTRTKDGDMYIATTAVVMTELVKTVVCLFMVLRDEGSVGNCLRHLNDNIIQV